MSKDEIMNKFQGIWYYERLYSIRGVFEVTLPQMIKGKTKVSVLFRDNFKLNKKIKFIATKEHDYYNLYNKTMTIYLEEGSVDNTSLSTEPDIPFKWYGGSWVKEEGCEHGSLVAGPKFLVVNVIPS